MKHHHEHQHSDPNQGHAATTPEIPSLCLVLSPSGSSFVASDKSDANLGFIRTLEPMISWVKDNRDAKTFTSADDIKGQLHGSYQVYTSDGSLACSSAS